MTTANPGPVVQPGGAQASPAVPVPAAVAAGADGQLDPNVVRQIEALQREKASRTPAQQKINSQLVFALKQSRGEPIAAGAVPQLRVGAAADANGMVLVDISATVSAGLFAEIAAVNGTIQDSQPNESPVRALIPLARLETLAAQPDVNFIRPAVLPMHNNSDPEGVVVHRDGVARSTFLADGTGVNVGVLSSSVDYLSQAQANGNLGTVTVLPGQSGVPGSGEGTAMLEIVHAMAPGAQLFYATGGPNEKQFATNILNLRFTYGCDIIVDDDTYADESPFQDMIVAQAVDAVTADGAWYFSSAANSGNLDSANSGTWEGDFLSGGSVSFPTNGLIHNFWTAGAPTNYNVVIGTNVEQGATVLFWSDPLGASTNDYDLFVLNSAGTQVVSASTDPQTGTQDPIEAVPPPALNERLVVVLASGTSRFLHIDTVRGKLRIGSTGSTRGHNAGTNAFTVAAVCACTSYPGVFTGGAANPVENFSSDGPRRMFYQASGTPLTPGNFSSTGGVVFQKPDFAAADGVTTDVPGGFAPFSGTSAAAPHAAAIAALLKSYNPTLTSAQVRSILTGSALDIMGAGVDRDSGYGLIMAYQALQATPPLPPSIGAVSPGSGAPGQVVYIAGNSLGGTTNVQFNGVNAVPTIQSNSFVIANVPFGATSGPLTLMTPGGSVSTPFTVLPAVPPANDDFANALIETGNAFVSATNTGAATKEAGEPNHAGNSGGKSVWFRWTAPATGTYMVDTIGSTFNTVLAVYTGGNVGSLSVVASNLNSGGNGASLLNFNAILGTTYQIAVDGSNGASGQMRVRLEPGTNTIYATAFEPVDGFVLGPMLSGQGGWTNTGSGTSGIVTNDFTGQGQQAYIGFSSPTPATNTFAYRPLNYTMDTNTRPTIQFNVELALTGNTTGTADQFWWIVRNTAGNALFGFDFQNSFTFLDYSLDSGGLVSSIPFNDNTIYNLAVTMDFGRNLWNATLNGTIINLAPQPITTTNASLTLGDIDAAWVFGNTSSPGNNYMLFDNYSVTAGPSLAPKIVVPPTASQTVPAGTNVFLGVAAEGAAPLTYQWYFNSGALTGVTNSTITLLSAAPNETGTYSVIVSNSLGTASAQAVVNVTNAPPFGAFGKPVLLGTNGIMFNVDVTVGNGYRFQASANLSNWVTLDTFYANGTNTLLYDVPVTNFGQRYYRLITP